MKAVLPALVVGLVGLAPGMVLTHWWHPPCARGDRICWTNYRATHQPANS